MLKTRGKADNKVSKVKVISKATDSSKVLVKVKMDRDKARVSQEVVMVMECRRKCKISTTVISRLSMI